MIKFSTLVCLFISLCLRSLLSSGQIVPPCNVSNNGMFWITGVSLGSINNATGYIGGNGRADYTSMSANMTAGVSYLITVNVNNGGWDNTCGLGIWADWNQNGGFESNETIFLKGNGSPAVTGYNATITPPVSAYNGKLLLRIRFLFSRDIGIFPCGEDDVAGETEDYAIDLTGATTPPASHNTCINADVEDGTFNGWTGMTGGNNDSGKPISGSTLEPLKSGIFSNGLNSNVDDTLARHTIVSGAGIDPYGIPVVAPQGGNFSIRLGGRYINPDVVPCNYYQCEPRWRAQTLRKTFMVDAANPVFSYRYVAVLQDAGTDHTPQDQPYFRSGLYDQNGKLVPCTDYYVFAASKIVNFNQVGTTNGSVVNANNWTTVTADLSPYIGQLITVEFTSACCIRGAHFGYAYIEATCGAAAITRDTICEESSITLTAPGGAQSYQWLPGNQTAQSISVNQPGKYTVKMTNAGNCVSSLTKEVYVKSMRLNLTGVNIGCGNQTGSANALVTSNTGPYIVPASAPFSYHWSPSGGTSAQATGLPAGTYTCTATDANGCSVTSSITITQTSGLSVMNTQKNASCFNASDGTATVFIDGGAQPYTYSWAPSGGTSFTATGLNAGTYTCSVTDANGCSAAVSVSITQPAALLAVTSSTQPTCAIDTGSASVKVSGGTFPYTYSWLPSGGTAATAFGLSAGSYTCNVTDSNGCKTAVTVIINDRPPLATRTSFTMVSCFGGSNGTASMIPSGGKTPYSYSWSLAGNTSSSISGLLAGTYTCTAADANGCTISAAVTITEPPALIINTSSTNISCFGKDNGSATVIASGGTPSYTYSWLPSGNTNASVSDLTAGSYTCTVTDNNGCTAGTVAVVNEGQKINVNFDPDTASCAPLAVTFKNLSNVTLSKSTCFWRFGDGGSSNDCSPSYTYHKQGTYSVTVIITSDGCTDSLTRNNIITVHPKPKADFSASPQPASIFNPLIFFKDQSAGDPVSWQWTFEDHKKDSPGKSSLQNPFYKYSDTGKYQAKLVVINQYGCKDSIVKYVLIDPEWSFYIPNAFTPNGDGKNDGFIGKSWNVIEHQMWIFDRWGNMIYTTGQTKDPESALPWNGKANGGAEEAQIDTYVWLVVLKDVFGDRHRYVGHVTLIK